MLDNTNMTEEVKEEGAEETAPATETAPEAPAIEEEKAAE